MRLIKFFRRKKKEVVTKSFDQLLDEGHTCIKIVTLEPPVYTYCNKEKCRYYK